MGEVRQGERRLFTGFVRDLTERQSTERRLQELHAELSHVSRLTEMGQMASGLAHELNQPLTAAANYLQALRRLVERGDAASVERAKGAAESAIGQVMRAGQIIRRLRDFVTKSDPERRSENVLTLLEEASGLALIGVKERGVLVRFRTARDLPPVLVDKVQIQQVMVNLLRNAVEAMEGCPRRELVIEAALGEDALVAIAVIDTGPGIAPDIAERLFQPFVTTKAQGMGVGLSICRSHHRGAWRTALDRAQSRGRHGLSLHRPGQGIGFRQAASSRARARGHRGGTRSRSRVRRQICSIRRFSCSTSPTISPMPRDRATAMISFISSVPSPLSLPVAAHAERVFGAAVVGIGAISARRRAPCAPSGPSATSAISRS